MTNALLIRAFGELLRSHDCDTPAFLEALSRHANLLAAVEVDPKAKDCFLMASDLLREAGHEWDNAGK